MEKDKITAIKKEGEQRFIRERINSLMWDVKMASENSVKDNLKNWSKEIYILKCRMEDAEQLYLELD